MPPEIVVALCSLAGTLAGSIGGIMVSNRLTTYRIDQLEKKVDLYNGLKDRVTIVEQSGKAVWKRVDEHTAKIEKLEEAI